jgi:hypothetical protein
MLETEQLPEFDLLYLRSKSAPQEYTIPLCEVTRGKVQRIEKLVEAPWDSVLTFDEESKRLPILSSEFVKQLENALEEELLSVGIQLAHLETKVMIWEKTTN